MELTAIQKYKMGNTKKLPNIKDLIGKVDTPLAMYASTYTDEDGEHNVLSVLLKENGIYKTETMAFIESFMNYWQAFGDLPDNEHPAIKIIGKDSKRGNPYVDMYIAD